MTKTRDEDATTIRCVRVGHGANCSSIGSVIDTLFATAVIGGAVFAAVAAALAREPVRVVGAKPGSNGPEPRGEATANEEREAP